MATLIGALVDVSGSMQQSIGGKQNHRGKWARSVFSVVDNLVKHDVSSSNHVFALGFGAENAPESFDILNTITKAKPPSVSANKSHRERLEAILDILEHNGAPRVRTWAKMSVLYSVVSTTDSELFLDWLSHDAGFRDKIVYECLPESCRKFTHGIGSYAREGTFWLASWVPQGQEWASEDSVRDVVNKGKRLLSKMPVEFVSIDQKAIMDVHRASDILHGCIGQSELSEERVDELMNLVEPHIYGGTPLMKTLRSATDLFAMRRFKDYNKLLFILSDGQPSDGNNPPVEELSRLGVKTVCCFITNDPIDAPKRLYSSECPAWDRAAKLMFQMSSYITTQLIPRTIFRKRGWTVDIDNNETRLFVQVNHPDIIEDVCELATDVVCCQEALSDVLSSVSLDLYINQANQGFVPKKQRGGTCYANASAAVLHLSMLRIVGREGGYPDFFQLRTEMVSKYGEHGANTVMVLQEICPRYRLQCKEVDIVGALQAVAAKRPVLARFRLTDSEWDSFSEFYRSKPRETLTRSELDIQQRRRSDGLSGHAVVLTSFSSRGLRLMNSWGSKWADGGFFTISNADVLGLEFVDVFWTIQDLKQSERDAHSTHGAGIAQKLISRLRGLQTAQYKCPLCNRKSNVIEFSGHSLETTCPKCEGQFVVTEADDDLALNLYLLSLSAPSPRSR